MELKLRLILRKLLARLYATIVPLFLSICIPATLRVFAVVRVLCFALYIRSSVTCDTHHHKLSPLLPHVEDEN